MIPVPEGNWDASLLAALAPMIDRVVGRVSTSMPWADEDDLRQEVQLVVHRDAEKLAIWLASGDTGLVFTHLRQRLLNAMRTEHDRRKRHVSFEAVAYGEPETPLRMLDNVHNVGLRGGYSPGELEVIASTIAR